MQKRWTAIFVLVCMLLGMLNLGSTALADSKTVYVASNTLKVYQKASSSSKTLGTMSYGEKMTCTAVDGSWAQVKNGDGDVGYCKKSGLTTDNPNTMDEKVYLSKTGVKVYEKPSTSSDVLLKSTESNLDDSYTAVARTEDGDWYRLKNGKYYGYVRDKYVVFAKDREEKEAEKELNETVYIKKSTLKIYNKASSSGKVLGTVGYGEQLTRVSVDGSWAQVRNSGGDVGYCKNSSLTEKNPNNKDLALYAKKDGVKVYQLPDDDSNVVAKLEKGEKMTLVAEVSSSWDRVKVSGEYGYVLSKNTTDDAPEVPEEEPEDEPEQPEDSEDEPEDEPEQPEDPKDEPEDEPEQPEDPKDEPEDEPEQTEDPKDEPEDEPEQPEDSEDEPEDEPERPEDSEDEPEDEPEQPEDSEDEPEDEPEQPEDPKDEPEDEPEQPEDSEDEPEEEPEQPEDSEDEPEEEPEQPEDSEDEPEEEPEQPEQPEEQPSGSIAEQIVALAKQQLGDPYVYAAHGPDRFDCSGLIYYCYLEIAGIKLARTAYSQGYDESYKKISDPSDLKLGDLVFFNTNTKDSDLSDHSGIYIGGGKFVHASSSAAKVITSDLTSGYYAGAFSWGRRVL